VAAYFRDHFVAAYQQVGSFEVVDEHGKLQRNGGNVASYFCTPEGRVIEAVTGPVGADELLAEAHWSVASYDEVIKVAPAEIPGLLAQAHRRAAVVVQGQARTSNPQAIHQLLASRPLPALRSVYQEIFERILGQRVNLPGDGIELIAEAVDEAKGRRSPILFVLHKERSNGEAVAKWNSLMAQGRRGKSDPLRKLAESYMVIALPLNALPAASQRLGIRPYAAPDKSAPLLVVTRPDGRQLTAVTTWDKTDELARALAVGLVQGAKEQPRTGEQLEQLLTVVKPVDARLAGEIRLLLMQPKSKGPALRSSRGGDKVAFDQPALGDFQKAASQTEGG
jgi:hypothetical protein